MIWAYWISTTHPSHDSDGQGLLWALCYCIQKAGGDAQCIWNTEGKKLRKVVKWWLNNVLSSVFALLSCSDYYKVNLNGKVSTMPTVMRVEGKLFAHNTDQYDSAFQFTVPSAVGWISSFACVASELCRNVCPWSKDTHKTVVLRVGVACTHFSCHRLPQYRGIIGRDVLSRLSCVFGLHWDFRFPILLSYFVVKLHWSTRKACIIPQRGIKWI